MPGDGDGGSRSQDPAARQDQVRHHRGWRGLCGDVGLGAGWAVQWAPGQLRSHHSVLVRERRFLFLDEGARQRFGDFKTGDFREIQETRLRIVGQTRRAQSFTTNPISFMDYDLLASLQPEFLGGKTSHILVRVANGSDVHAVRSELQRRLPYQDVFTRDEWAKKSRDYWVVNTGVRYERLLENRWPRRST